MSTQGTKFEKEFDGKRENGKPPVSKWVEISIKIREVSICELSSV